MIYNKNYYKTIQEMEWAQNNKYNISDANYKHSPTYLIEESKIDYASYITWNEHSLFGVLHIFTPQKLQFQNVYQYFLFVIDSDGKINPVFPSSYILEVPDLKDFFLICMHPTAIDSEKMGADQIISCDLNIYRTDTLLHTIHNVQRIDKIGVDLRIIYTSQENENIYRHWVYKNGTSELLLEDALSWTSKSQNSLLIPTEYANIYNEHGMIEIIFHELSCKACLILKEFSSTVDAFQIVPNIFADDTTINYRITISQDRLDDISFVQYCLGQNIDMGNYAIYDIPLSRLKMGCCIPPSPQKVISELNKLNLTVENESFFAAIIDMLFDRYGERKTYFFPKEFSYKNMIHSLQFGALTDFLNKYHPAYIESQHGNRQLLTDHLFKMKLLYNDIFDRLVTNHIIIPKWKSEYSLYELVKKKYSDAIYQYRAQWLGQQSLDIFIPELLTAIEYQGIQHFKPIDIFGGKEHFERQQKLDEQKRMLCKSNNIRLIEWRCDEPISSLVLKSKLSEI